jgi:hypothetical protein
VQLSIQIGAYNNIMAFYPVEPELLLGFQGVGIGFVILRDLSQREKHCDLNGGGNVDLLA